MNKATKITTTIFLSLIAVPLGIIAIINTALEDSKHGFASGLGIRNYACFIIFWMILFMPLILKLF